MDPELIDLVWTLHETLGSKEPVKLICGYRSASTNNSLRRRGGGQAKNSQHILGKAADIQFPDVPVKTLRNSALVQEWGGVGYYPTSGVPFVHVDTGRVRMWPRMARLELAALFPMASTQVPPHQTASRLRRRTTSSPSPRADARRDHGRLRRPKPSCSRRSQTAGEAPRADPRLLQPRGHAASHARRPLPIRRLRRRFRARSASPMRVPAAALPAPGPLSRDKGFPLYNSAEVVGAPEADEDHPDELSYVPFEIASLMTDVSVAYNHAVAELTPPEQKDLSYLFEDMDRPAGGDLPPDLRLSRPRRRAELRRPRGAEPPGRDRAGHAHADSPSPPAKPASAAAMPSACR